MPVRSKLTFVPTANNGPLKVPLPVTEMACVGALAVPAVAMVIEPGEPEAEVTSMVPLFSMPTTPVASVLLTVMVPPAPEPGAMAVKLATFFTGAPVESTLFAGFRSA